MMGSAALLCVASLLPSVDGIALDDSTIRTAVAAWLSNSASAEATYGHISTWDTSGVTDMSYLFCGYGSSCNMAWASFNEDIGAWDTSGVTTMYGMFYGASAFNQDIGGWAVHSVVDICAMFQQASSFNQDLGDWAVDSVKSMRFLFYNAYSFDQDLGWCVDDDVDLEDAFGPSWPKDRAPQCAPTSCGVVRCPTKEKEQIPVAIIAGTAAAAVLLVVGAFCFYRRRKASTMDKADEPSGTSSPPKSNPEPTELPPDEESPKTRTAAKAEAAETAERPGFTRKLSSFLFGEQEEEPTLIVAEAEEAPSAEQPPPPPTPAEPAAPKAEEMYNQIAAWYNEPENTALRARWGAYPEPEEFQTWPGFVAVTNAFLDREAG